MSRKHCSGWSKNSEKRRRDLKPSQNGRFVKFARSFCQTKAMFCLCAGWRSARMGPLSGWLKKPIPKTNQKAGNKSEKAEVVLYRYCRHCGSVAHCRMHLQRHIGRCPKKNPAGLCVLFTAKPGVKGVWLAGRGVRERWHQDRVGTEPGKQQGAGVFKQQQRRFQIGRASCRERGEVPGVGRRRRRQRGRE